MVRELTPRQLQILNLAVSHFIETAEAVSSRTLAKRYRLPFSPATIRNEMADLEEMGYMMQPHTSAGRVPTDKGYQAYVASLRDPHVSEDERLRLERLEGDTLNACKEAQELLQDAIAILSTVTSLVGVAAFPAQSQKSFTKLQLTLVDPRQMLVVLVTDASRVEAHLVPLGSSVPQELLDMCSRLINDQFVGQPLSEFVDHVANVVHVLESSYRVYVQSALQAFVQKLGKAPGSDVLVWGACSMLSQPEFQDFQKAREVLDMLEKRELLGRMLAGTEGTGAQITFVGVTAERGVSILRGFSLVSSVYRVRGAVKGAIGILGPRRMDYPKIITYVNHISDSLSRVFSEK